MKAMRWPDEDEPAGFQRLRQRSRGPTYSFRKASAVEGRAIAEQSARDHGCTKAAFRSKAAAELRMSRSNSRPGGAPKQCRHAYRCERCGSWHLTSMPSAASHRMHPRG